MFLPIVPTHYGQIKPAGLPKIDWSNPITTGLVFYGFDTGSFCVDLVGSNGQATKTGTITSALTPLGTALNYDPGTFGNYSQFTVNAQLAAVLNSTYFTMSCGLFGYAPSNSDDTDAFLIGNSSASRYLSLFYYNTPTSWIFVTPAGTHGSGASLTSGAFNTLTAACNNTTANFYLNGVLNSSSSLTTQTTFASGDFICIGGDPTSNYDNFSAQSIFNAGIWSRVLSPSEILQLQLDPYSFLVFPEDEIFEALIGVGGTPQGWGDIDNTIKFSRRSIIDPPNEAIFQPAAITPQPTWFGEIETGVRAIHKPPLDFSADIFQSPFQSPFIVPQPDGVVKSRLQQRDFFEYPALGEVPSSIVPQGWKDVYHDPIILKHRQLESDFFVLPSFPQPYGANDLFPDKVDYAVKRQPLGSFDYPPEGEVPSPAVVHGWNDVFPDKIRAKIRDLSYTDNFPQEGFVPTPFIPNDWSNIDTGIKARHFRPTDISFDSTLPSITFYWIEPGEAKPFKRPSIAPEFQATLGFFPIVAPQGWAFEFAAASRSNRLLEAFQEYPSEGEVPTPPTPQGFTQVEEGVKPKRKATLNIQSDVVIQAAVPQQPTWFAEAEIGVKTPHRRPADFNFDVSQPPYRVPQGWATIDGTVSKRVRPPSEFTMQIAVAISTMATGWETGRFDLYRPKKIQSRDFAEFIPIGEVPSPPLVHGWNDQFPDKIKAKVRDATYTDSFPQRGSVPTPITPQGWEGFFQTIVRKPQFILIDHLAPLSPLSPIPIPVITQRINQYFLDGVEQLDFGLSGAFVQEYYLGGVAQLSYGPLFGTFEKASNLSGTYQKGYNLSGGVLD